MSLREEIEHIIHGDNFETGSPVCDGCSAKANEILKLIENRIDSVKMEGYANAGWVSACVRMKEEVSTT